MGQTYFTLPASSPRSLIQTYLSSAPMPQEFFELQCSGQTIFQEKELDQFTKMELTGGLPPSIKPRHSYVIFGQSERGDTFARKISYRKISKVGIYPEITIKNFLAFSNLFIDSQCDRLLINISKFDIEFIVVIISYI